MRRLAEAAYDRGEYALRLRAALHRLETARLVDQCARNLLLKLRIRARAEPLLNRIERFERLRGAIERREVGGLVHHRARNPFEQAGIGRFTEARDDIIVWRDRFLMASELAEPRRLVDQRHPDFLLNRRMRAVAEAIYQLAVCGYSLGIAFHLTEAHATLEPCTRDLRLDLGRGILVEARDHMLA